jgi:hypothetical protein
MNTGVRATKARGNHPHWDKKLGKERAKSSAEPARRRSSKPMATMTLPGVLFRTGGEVAVDLFKLFPQGPGFLLQLSSGPKYRYPVVLNLYGIAGFWVSGFSSLSCFYLESAKTPQLNDPVLEKTAFYFSKEQIQNGMDVLFTDANLRVDLLDDLSFGELVHTHPLPRYFSVPANTLCNLCFFRAAVFL